MIQIQDNLDDDAWRAALALLPVECRDVYLTPEFYRLQVADQRGEPLASFISYGEKRLLILGLRSPIPSRLGLDAAAGHWDLQSGMGFGSVAASPEAEADPEFLQAAWTKWTDRRFEEGMVAAFFRLHPLLDDARWLPPGAEVRAFRKTAYADLTGGVEAAWLSSAHAHRKQVNKGKRAELQVIWDAPRDWDELENFYKSEMRRIGAWADAFYSPEYFALQRNFPGAQLACIREGDRLVAASVFLFGPRWGHYHISARSADSAPYTHNCILQAALERVAQLGLSGMHLGGGTTTAPDDSHLKFKQNVGSTLVDYRIALVIANPGLYAGLRKAWVDKAGQQPSWLMAYQQPLPEGSKINA